MKTWIGRKKSGGWHIWTDTPQTSPFCQLPADTTLEVGTLAELDLRQVTCDACHERHVTMLSVQYGDMSEYERTALYDELRENP